MAQHTETLKTTMAIHQRSLSKIFSDFFDSEKSSGMVLIGCTVIALLLANSSIGTSYLAFWHRPFGGLSLGQWVNDALMSVFFLLIGLEPEREIYNGELSDFRNALLPQDTDRSGG